MSRSQQDQFIDDDEEEEVCPLCVEELDLTDKHFRPCPCGYQICQFCYNNIKTTMNGLCPACRRPYDDENIQYKAVSAEQMAQHKQNLAQQAKKKAAARQKEAQKREADHLSRKHLAGLRVRQRNLVYVTGLRPSALGDRLVERLRQKDMFGQYGDIVKVVVAKSKDTGQPQQRPPVGVYVTFARKEDAAACITSIDGHRTADGSRLRAQYGTTKYCSAYLRNEQCTNNNCMFLHEPGEDSESFTRQDLSSLNAISSQQPNNPSGSVPSQSSPLSSAPVQQAIVPPSNNQNEVAVASPTDSTGDGSALPPTANWVDQARRASRTSGSTNSPLAASAVPSQSQPAADTTAENVQSASAETDEKPTPSVEQAITTTTSKAESSKTFNLSTTAPNFFVDFVKKAFEPKVAFCFKYPAHFSDKDKMIVEMMPPLFDPNGGVRRRLMRERAAEELLRREAEIKAEIEANDETEENPEGGSSQLGGEPEERPDRAFSRQHAVISPSQQVIGSSHFGLQNLSEELATGVRSLTPHQTQQQQLLLQQLKIAGAQQGPQHGGPSRGQSRYAFTNEGLGGVSRNLAKQPASALGQVNHYGNSLMQNQSLGNHPYSNVQGPPPGLKTTGTPPVSGGGMFGQGHGFTQGFGSNAAREGDRAWEMHRARGNAGASQGPDAGKREYMFPSYHQYPSTSAAPGGGLSNYYGSQPGAGFPETGGAQKQKKKGKKHRHANTSSSGGGVVDVGDPSILQMRVGNSMAAQGAYGAPGQGGFPSSLHGNAYSRGW